MIVSGTILVVDDEDAIRMALADALESQSYAVMQAASPMKLYVSVTTGLLTSL
jgi:DNA-binding response OmpR family regulator